VFHFTIQAYFALLLMALVLLLSVAAQIVAQPYAQPLLHRLHLASTCCLCLIVWLSLAMFSSTVVVDSASLRHANIAFGALMVVIALSFVTWCLVLIVRLASPLLREWASCSAVWLRDCTGGVASATTPASSSNVSTPP
jgi:hypothetical protein